MLKKTSIASSIGGAFSNPAHDAVLARRSHRHRSLPQSSSASRFTAAQAGFFELSQSGERPERYAESLRLQFFVCALIEAMPSERQIVLFAIFPKFSRVDRNGNRCTSCGTPSQ
jgi:hypothetical protein